MKKTILKGLVGSHAYGVATENSDKDYMTVYIDPLDHYFGLKSSNTKHSVSEVLDNTEYEFLKFMKLCLNFNPNVVPLLFLDEYLEVDKLGEVLLQNKNLFVTKKAYVSLIGYAVSQKKKAETGATEKFGEKRKNLIEIFGYDIKAASHTVRLLHLAKHLFQYNEVNIKAGAEEVLEFKLGKHPKMFFEERFSTLLKESEKLYETCTLPETVDFEAVNSLCTLSLIRNFIGKY